MEKILEILKEIRPEIDFASSDDYIGDGLLDSLVAIALVGAIEEDFGILIDALDLLPENFVNVKTIAALIEKNGGKIQ